MDKRFKNNKEIVLAIRNLKIQISKERKIFPLIKDFSLEIEKGSITALLGESGAGKSLIASAILGLLPTPPFLPPQGEILYKGKNLLSLSRADLQNIRGKNISIIFQEPKSALNPVFTIGDQLFEACSKEKSDEEKRNRVFSCLEEVQLREPKKIFNSYPHELSGGMLQRVLIASALLGESDLLIADEPTTSLDVTIQAQILELLLRLQEKRRLSILLITHDLGVVAEIADKVSVIYSGQIMEEGRCEEIFEGPAHPYTSALFEARFFSPRNKTVLINESSQEDVRGCSFQKRCPYALPICKELAPPLFPLRKQEFHKASCFLYDPKLETHISYEEDS